MLLLGIFGLLFAMAYATHRRFGMLGLALAAGALLADHWTGMLTPFIEQQGVVLSAPPLTTVVQAVLILLPSLALLFNGPAYSGRWPQIGGALAFAVFGLVLLAHVLVDAIAFEGIGRQCIVTLTKYSSILVVIGIIGAVTDVLLTTHGKPKKREH